MLIIFSFSLVHGDASLLPCHRLLMNAWFFALRKHCDYQGDLLYMDFWTYANKNEVWTSEDIWSDDYYGTSSGLVRNGVFGDCESGRVRCLRRYIRPEMARLLTMRAVWALQCV